MINLSLIRHFAALLTLVFLLGNATAVPMMTATATASQPAMGAGVELFKSRMDGCNAALQPLDLLQSESKEKLAARTSSPMCTYLERCCSGNTDNAAKCCAGMLKNC